MTRDLTSAVIAGGKSTRFGGLKQRAMVDGRSLLDRAVDLAMDLADRVLVVDNGQAGRKRPGVHYLHDRVPDCGPLGGIDTAFSILETPWLAVIPCDMPRLSPFVYRTIWDRRIPDCVLVAVSPSGLEPMVSIWPANQQDAVRSAIEEGKWALRRLLKDLPVHPVALSTGVPGIHLRWYDNVNLPDDLIPRL